MTKAFIFEVQSVDGSVAYLNLKGRLTKRPYFFSSAKSLKSLESRSSWRCGSEYFNAARDINRTSVTVSSSLEKGLRASTAERYSYQEFAKKFLEPKQPEFSKNDVFKIKLTQQNDRPKKEFIGNGKFGKTWETAGLLRSFISCNLFTLQSALKDAEVLQITMGPDGVTPLKITKHDLKAFYLASSSSAEFYAKHKSSFTA